MNSFKVGDICIGVGLQFATDRNGMECEIRSPLKWREVRTCTVTGERLPPAAAHWVRWADGNAGLVRPELLRLKRPPEEPGSWQEIEKLTNWSPNKALA